MLETILQDFMANLLTILEEVKEQKAVTNKEAESLDLAPFFNHVRTSLFNNRLTVEQVAGMEAKIKTFKNEGFSVSHAAYALATSFHETAQRMQPVREGLNASDNWRKRNLRYYPWYGRGDVQLTWKDNYIKADKKLGLNGQLISNPDLALDPVISSKIMAKGMAEGWFSADRQGNRHTLARHLPDAIGTRASFKQARRIINLMDKADLIAGYAILFQEALLATNYQLKGV